ncbi:MAG: purine-nucleoside phosphorylase [Bacteroidales bacterium]|nr:purine-nucleoside phosphorylase [Bacteroidales bacterium]
MLRKINETAGFLIEKYGNKAKIAIVLGTGLNNLCQDIDVEQTVSYADIPNFPVSTVAGHAGNLLFGKLSGVDIVAMQGRFHYYEGYDMKQITFPIRVFKAMGIETLILSNASGGMNPNFHVGDIMMITDHINLFPEHPLRGKNEDVLGDRFPDMSETYCKILLQKAEDIAQKHAVPYQKGVYVGTQGPTFETPAEYKMFRILGGDCVGMSTVPEAIVAHHAKMKCIAFSIIADLGVVGQVDTVSHQEVLNAAVVAEPKLRLIVKELVKVI